MSAILWGFNFLELMGVLGIIVGLVLLGVWLKDKGKKDVLYWIIGIIGVIVFLQMALSINVLAMINAFVTDLFGGA